MVTRERERERERESFPIGDGDGEMGEAQCDGVRDWGLWENRGR